MISRHPGRARAATAAALAAALLVAGCQQQDAKNVNEDIKKDLDQLVASSKETSAQLKDLANTSKGTSDAVKALTARVDEMAKDLSGQLGRQKRGALYLQLDVPSTCDNDDQCSNTARAVCNRINYPNAVTSRFEPGVRPVLHSLICFD